MSKESTPDADIGELPSIWQGLWGKNAEGPYLNGGRCKSCGHVTLEVRKICPSCWASDEMEATPIGREGTLYTYTIIHQAPAGFEAPIAVGYVDLPEGVRVFAHLDLTPETLRVAGKVALAIEPLKTSENGNKLYGPRYSAA
jgi:uncharacterized OB-fold protein